MVAQAVGRVEAHAADESLYHWRHSPGVDGKHPYHSALVAQVDGASTGLGGQLVADERDAFTQVLGEHLSHVKGVAGAGEGEYQVF